MKQEAYLGIQDQESIRWKFAEAEKLSKKSEVFVLNNGEKIATLSCLTAGLVFWRAGFKAFNLNKFGRFRVTTLLFNAIFCLHGGCAHIMLVNDKLYDNFRSESTWNFAARSLIANQFGLFCSSFGTVGATFALAQRFGLVPIPHNMFHAEVRPVLREFLVNSLRPHLKSVSRAWIISSLFMMAIGARQYQESCHVLSKINRKTLSQVEI